MPCASLDLRSTMNRSLLHVEARSPTTANLMVRRGHETNSSQSEITDSGRCRLAARAGEINWVGSNGMRVRSAAVEPPRLPCTLDVGCCQHMT